MIITGYNNNTLKMGVQIETINSCAPIDHLLIHVSLELSQRWSLWSGVVARRGPRQQHGGAAGRRPPPAAVARGGGRAAAFGRWDGGVALPDFPWRPPRRCRPRGGGGRSAGCAESQEREGGWSASGGSSHEWRQASKDGREVPRPGTYVCMYVIS
jgi:hypothetical protein